MEVTRDGAVQDQYDLSAPKDLKKADPDAMQVESEKVAILVTRKPPLIRRDAVMPYCRGGRPDKKGVYIFCPYDDCVHCTNKQLEIMRQAFSQMGNENTVSAHTAGSVWSYTPLHTYNPSK